MHFDLTESNGSVWYTMRVTLLSSDFQGYADKKFYLPTDSEGLHIMKLLYLAFERRLLFRVNPITLRLEPNGLELKERTDGGAIRMGYPDESYYYRIKEVLKSVGIT